MFHSDRYETRLASLPGTVNRFIVTGMELLAPAAPRRVGRPLSFDREAALERAMLLFWRHGYETTSVSDLTAAMGITAPSLYTAYGDKKRLFLEAVERYRAGPVSVAEFIEGALTARAAAWGLLEGSVLKFTGETTPPGCLLASAAASGSSQADDVREALASVRREIEALLAGRIMADAESGALPADTDAEALAAHVLGVIQGLSTLARDGAPRGKLMRVAACAMAAWPADVSR